MTIELVPVLEIGYDNQGVPIPDQFPYWEYPDLWNRFHEESYSKAGFPDKLPVYLPGSSFVKLIDLTDKNLTKLTTDHTEDMRLGKYPREQAGAFFGGYVLKLEGKDAYFPQCCGDLSDIIYWQHLLNYPTSFYYQGHPEPKITITKNYIELDFTVGEFDESFSPPPLKSVIVLAKDDLRRAVDHTQRELFTFAQRIKQINIEAQLGIEDIDKLLIWGNNQ